MQINGAGILSLFSKVERIGSEINDNLKIENRGNKKKLWERGLGKSSVEDHEWKGCGNPGQEHLWEETHFQRYWASWPDLHKFLYQG